MALRESVEVSGAPQVATEMNPGYGEKLASYEVGGGMTSLNRMDVFAGATTQRRGRTCGFNVHSLISHEGKNRCTAFCTHC